MNFTYNQVIPLCQVDIEQVDIVDEFVRKKGCKLVANGEAPFSILDWATLIKTGKTRYIISIKVLRSTLPLVRFTGDLSLLV
jgi:hypothetical protein